MRIRPAKAGDAGAIAALSGELGYPADAGDVARRLRWVTEAHDHVAFVAEDDGQVVGWIHVFSALRLESEQFAEIGGLVVAESHRRRGVGRLLCERAVWWAEVLNLETLRVRTRVEREAHLFYRRVGFRETKQQRVLVLPIAE
jgi:predicted N-acetyltransferase YhbS